MVAVARSRREVASGWSGGQNSMVPSLMPRTAAPAVDTPEMVVPPVVLGTPLDLAPHPDPERQGEELLTG